MRGTCFSAWIGRPNPEPNIGLVDDDADAFLVTLEHAFDISLPGVTPGKLQTLADLQAIILQNASGYSADQVWDALTQCAHQQSHVDARHMTPTMHLFERVYA